MSKRIFDHDPLTGETTYFEATDEGFNLITEADVEPILDLNAQKRSMGRQFYAADKDFWKYASVPNIVLLKWAGELGIPGDKVFSDEFAEIVGRKLRSSEFYKLKVADITL